MKHLILTAVAAALIVPAGRLGAQGSPAAVLPSITLPPALERVLRDYERAWGTSDAAALAALFTPDGFVLQPNRPPVRGRAELVQRYTGQGGGDLRLRPLAYATGDSVGYIIGAYGYGDTPGDVGKFTLTLRRVSDRWLIFSDMDNGNAAPRRPPSR
jgi:ketosteroid isomerase-like protein